MSEVSDFGELVLVVSSALLLALLCSRLSSGLRIPAAALLLIGAAVASDIAPRLGTIVSIHDVTRIGVVALIVILFDGGMDLGWRSVRRSIGPVLGLGIVGTFATAGIMAAAAHYLLGLDWVPAAVIGTALSPTDPAVMFSVLGDHGPEGRGHHHPGGGVGRQRSGWNRAHDRSVERGARTPGTPTGTWRRTSSGRW